VTEHQKIRFRILALLASVVAALFLCAAAQPQAAPSDDDQIREAVARYQIASWDLKAEIYFLSIDAKDPSDAFMKRFADTNPPVKRKSVSKRTKDLVSTIVEAKTEKMGVLFDQGAIRKLGDTKADVSGGYDCGSLRSATGVYHLELREKRWVVTGFSPQ
jgi:hypothetical protein